MKPLMHIIDLLIIVFAISSIFRGYQIGFIRQAFSTIGFVAGLFIGSALGTVLASLTRDSATASIVSIGTLLVVSFGLMTLGEIVGVRVKVRWQARAIHQVDGVLGVGMSLATLVIALWLAAGLLLLAPSGPVQQIAQDSRIITTINKHMPPVNRFLSALNNLIDPNAFPQVFTGKEPLPNSNATLPPDSAFAVVLAESKPAVVKIEGLGCGGIVNGSGFVAAKNRVVTNAHVVAGVRSPKVVDENGVHNAQVVYFDTKNDLAFLATEGVTATPLPISTTALSGGAGTLVAGYPAGGVFDAQTAAVLDRFTAIGRDIYGQSITKRDIYSIQARVVQGNSGGPVINSEGEVVGIVFATSTSYNNVGYALTTNQVAGELARIKDYRQATPTGQCSNY
jgi:S1-C subfamily serine protease